MVGESLILPSRFIVFLDEYRLVLCFWRLGPKIPCVYSSHVLCYWSSRRILSPLILLRGWLLGRANDEKRERYSGPCTTNSGTLSSCPSGSIRQDWVWGPQLLFLRLILMVTAVRYEPSHEALLWIIFRPVMLCAQKRYYHYPTCTSRLASPFFLLFVYIIL